MAATTIEIAITANTGDAEPKIKVIKRSLDDLGQTAAGLISPLNALKSALGAVGVAFSAVSFVAGIKSAINAVNDFQGSVIQMSAMLTSLSKNQSNIADTYKKSKAYAEELNVVLQKVDAKTTLNLTNLQVITQEMAKQGVALKLNSQSQIDNFTKLANAVAVYSRNGADERQVRQEVAALMKGEVKAGDELAKLMDKLVGGNLSEMVKKWKESGTAIDEIGARLSGFGPAADDLSKTWGAVLSSLETTANVVARAGFTDIVSNLVTSLGKVNEYLQTHAELIGNRIQQAWLAVKGILASVGSLIGAFSEPLEIIYGLTGMIAKGWGWLLSSVFPPLIERIAEFIRALWETVKLVGNIVNMGAQAAVGNWAAAADAWNAAKANYKAGGVQVGKAFKAGFLDEVGKGSDEFLALDKLKKKASATADLFELNNKEKKGKATDSTADINSVITEYNRLQEQAITTDESVSELQRTLGKLGFQNEKSADSFTRLYNSSKEARAEFDKQGITLEKINALYREVAANAVAKSAAKGQETLDKALAADNLASFKSTLAAEKSALDDSLAQRTISHKEYYSSYDALIRKEADYEISTLEATLTKAIAKRDAALEAGPPVGGYAAEMQAEVVKASTALETADNKRTELLNKNHKASIDNINKEQAAAVAAQKSILEQLGLTYEATVLQVEQDKKSRGILDEKTAALYEQLDALKLIKAKQDEVNTAASKEASIATTAAEIKAAASKGTGFGYQAIDDQLAATTAAINERYSNQQRQIQATIDLNTKLYNDEIANIRRMKDEAITAAEKIAAKSTTPIDVEATAKALLANNKAYTTSVDVATNANKEIATSTTNLNHTTTKGTLETTAAEKAATQQKIQLTSSYVSTAASLFETLANAQDQSSRSGFESAKAYNIAAAIMNTASGIMNAYATASNVYVGIAMAALVAATGAIQIAKISSTTYGGGDTSVSAPSGSVASAYTGSTGYGYNESTGVSVGKLSENYSSIQDSMTVASLNALTESTDNVAVVIGRLSTSIDKLNDLFSEGGAGYNLALNAPNQNATVQSSIKSVSLRDLTTGSSGASGLTNFGAWSMGMPFLSTKTWDSLFGGSWVNNGGGIGLGYDAAGIGAIDYTLLHKSGGVFGKSGDKFGSVKTDSAVGDYMNDILEPFRSEITRMATTLGLSTDNMKYVVNEMKLIQTTGRTTDAINTDIETWFTELLNRLALSVVGPDEIGAYENAREKLIAWNDALVSTNTALEKIGATTIQGSVANAKALVSMQDLFGGMDAFTEAIDTYYTTMYTDAEQAAMNRKSGLEDIKTYFDEINQYYVQLAEAGDKSAAAWVPLSTSTITTNEQFRNLVNGLDITTESGAATFQALISISSKFSEVSAAIEDLADTNMTYEITLMEQQGLAYEALQAQRLVDIKNMDDSTVALYDLVKAGEALVALSDKMSSFNSTYAGIGGIAGKTDQLKQSVIDAFAELRLGENPAPITMPTFSTPAEYNTWVAKMVTDANSMLSGKDIPGISEYLTALADAAISMKSWTDSWQSDIDAAASAAASAASAAVTTTVVDTPAATSVVDPNAARSTTLALLATEADLMKDTAAAARILAEQRQIELSTMSAGDAAIQQHIWLLQDADDIHTKYLAREAATRDLQMTEAELMGDTAKYQQLLNTQRSLELQSLSSTDAAIQAHIWTLQDQADAAEKAATALNTTLGLQLTEAELMGDTIRYKNIQNQQREIELKGMSEGDQAIQRHIWALQDAAGATDDAATALKELRANAVTAAEDMLSRSIDAEKDRLQAIADATSAALTDAEDVLTRSYAAQRDIIVAGQTAILDGLNASLTKANESVTALQTSFDMLKSARESMALTEDSSITLANAQAELAKILAAARRGDTSGIAGMSSVLDTVKGINTDSYATDVDYRRAFWQTSNSIAELESITGAQLTDAQKQVAALEKLITDTETANTATLAAFDAELDAIKGIKTNTLPIAEARANYLAAKAADDAAQLELTTQTAWMQAQYDMLTNVNTSVMSVAAAISNLQMAQAAQIVSAVADVVPQGGSPGATFLGNQPQSSISNAVPSGGAPGATFMGNQIFETNPNGIQDTITNSTTSTVGWWNLPSFDVGTASVPYDMLANIHQGEIIMDRQSADVLRKYGIPTSGTADNAELVNEVKALRAEIRAVALHTQKSAKTLDKWDGDGMPAVAV